MDGYNLFEPDLELDVNTIPYEDMGIQGVWPRKQRTPSDVFPANANLVARGENNKARWCKADKDGILYTHDISGGGGSSGPAAIIPKQNTHDVVLSTSGSDDSFIVIPFHNYIIGWEFSGACIGAIEPNDSSMVFSLFVNGGIRSIILARVYPWEITPAGNVGKSFHLYGFFDHALDVKAMVAAGADNIDVGISACPGDFALAWTLWWSDVI